MSKLGIQKYPCGSRVTLIERHSAISWVGESGTVVGVKSGQFEYEYGVCWDNFGTTYWITESKLRSL